MKLLSVNVAKPRAVFHNDQPVHTGIFKIPVKGRAMMRSLNIDGDGQADLKNHGGEYKAVYTYDIQNYAHWEKELRRDDFTFGQFGENLTTEGMTEDEVFIGDIFRIGGAVAEVSQPRNPCFKLGISMAGCSEFISALSKKGKSALATPSSASRQDPSKLLSEKWPGLEISAKVIWN